MHRSRSELRPMVNGSRFTGIMLRVASGCAPRLACTISRAFELCRMVIFVTQSCWEIVGRDPVVYRMVTLSCIASRSFQCLIVLALLRYGWPGDIDGVT